jgi:hypothetical protein
LNRLDPAGAAATLERAVLSDERGAFAVRATAPGRFELVIKRIGQRRHRVAPFSMDPGETVVRNVVLDPVAVALPEVVVSGVVGCDATAAGDHRLEALWDDARAALLATQLSLRDSLFSASVQRYVRELDPRSRRVVSETRSEARGRVAPPFLTAEPESLSAHGYLRMSTDGVLTFFGVDPGVLTSEAFVRDHCFRVVRGGRDQRQFIGVSFRPARDSGATTDVAGTLWMDERSSELRYVEFRYSRLPPPIDSTQVFGQLHFSRLASGAWMVQRWFLRLPVAAQVAPPLSTQPSAASWVLVRPTAPALREEGGSVSVNREHR